MFSSRSVVHMELSFRMGHYIEHVFVYFRDNDMPSPSVFKINNRMRQATGAWRYRLISSL